MNTMGNSQLSVWTHVSSSNLTNRFWFNQEHNLNNTLITTCDECYFTRDIFKVTVLTFHSRIHLHQKGEDFPPLDALSKEMEEDWNPWFPPAFGGTHMQDLSWSTTRPIHTADQSNLMNVWFHMACNLDIHMNTVIPISPPTFHLWFYHVCIHICMTKSILSFHNF